MQTIHSFFYERDEKNSTIDLERFMIAENKLDKEKLVFLIVDEAGTIGDKRIDGPLLFGSGRLLNDIFDFIDFENNPIIRLIIVGDANQNPPIREELSPALSRKYLKQHFNVDAECLILRKVHRQKNAELLEFINQFITESDDD